MVDHIEDEVMGAWERLVGDLGRWVDKAQAAGDLIEAYGIPRQKLYRELGPCMRQLADLLDGGADTRHRDRTEVAA